LKRKEVLEALEIATDRSSAAYRAAEAKAAGLPEEQAIVVRRMTLVPVIADVLKRQPEYDESQNTMLRGGLGGSYGMQAETIAYRMLEFSAARGNRNAVNILANVLRQKSARGIDIMPLWGVSVTKSISLCKGIMIRPFSDIPNSNFKNSIINLRRASLNYFLPMPGFWLSQVGPPEAALVAGRVINPLFVDANDPALPDQEFGRMRERLERIALCLNALLPDPVLGLLHWFEFDNPGLNLIAPGGIVGSSLEVIPSRPLAAAPLNAEAARSFVRKYLRLPPEMQARIAVALQRLVHAMMKRDAGDRAADLSIALETLLGDDNRGEHRWKVSTRAAILSASDHASRLANRRTVAAAYDLRSATVHTGGGRGRRQNETQQIVSDTFPICAAVIRSIVHKGMPSWPDFDVSGGLAGWP
jgi:hypothetical protein